jgi:hypothetical protein
MIKKCLCCQSLTSHEITENHTSLLLLCFFFASRILLQNQKLEEFMNAIIKLIYAIIWLGFAIGVGEVFYDFTASLRTAAIHAHQKGPISYKLYTEQLTGQK